MDGYIGKHTGRNIVRLSLLSLLLYFFLHSSGLSMSWDTAAGFAGEGLRNAEPNQELMEIGLWDELLEDWGDEKTGRKMNLSEVLARTNSRLEDNRLRRIVRAIRKYSHKYELDPNLITAVIIVESTAKPDAVSPKGAVGLMQVMPYMATRLGFKGDLFAIDDNVNIGTFILADNIQRWGYREGVERYFWGSNKITSTTYMRKITRILDRIDKIDKVEKTDNIHKHGLVKSTG